MSLINKYFTLTEDLKKEYGERSVVLMQVGSFYEVYAIKNEAEKCNKNGNGNVTYEKSNIVDVANICDFKIANKRGGDDLSKAIVMVGFPQYNLDKFLKKLQIAEYTVAVYKQDENISGTSRSLEGIYSPGTWICSDNDMAQLTNCVSCVWIQNTRNGKIVGMCNIDVVMGASVIYEYEEVGLQPSFDQVERFISVHNPKEVIFIYEDTNKFINKVKQFSNSVNRTCHLIDLNDMQNVNSIRASKCDQQTYQYEIFERFFKSFNFTEEILKYALAVQATTYLLDWVWRHNPNLMKNIRPPLFENYSNNVLLGNHSLKQLNIINDSNLITNSKYSCVSNLINQCVTAMGKRKTYYSLVHPTFCHQTLDNLYSITAYILEHFDYSTARSMMSNVKDIDKFIRQQTLNQLVPCSIYYFSRDLGMIQKMFKLINKKQGLKKGIKNLSLMSYDTVSEDLVFLNDKINDIMDVDLCSEVNQVETEMNYIKPNYDKDHDLLVTKCEDTSEDLEAVRKYLSGIVYCCEGSKAKKSDLVVLNKTDKYGYTLTTTKRRAVILMNGLKSSKSSQSSKAECPYLKSLDCLLDVGQLISVQGAAAANQIITSEQIKQLCTNMTNGKSLVIASQNRLFGHFCHQIGEWYDKVKNICDFVTTADYLMNLAYISKKYNYCRPSIKNNGNESHLMVTGLRHPLIENILNDEIYVTNDVTFDTNNQGYLLYGTNAVGKSSFIKSIGIAVILAQAGFYVPCKSFEFFPYKKLFTRIIGNDNIFKGLSTFAVEMLEFKNIIDNCCESSLILGDELCSGTETDSAISIILAGLNNLYAKQAGFIFATHFHEIVDYDEITAKKNLHVKHMSIIYNAKEDALIYDRKLKAGAGDSMYGLEVCKSLHLPSDFLIDAHEIRNKYNKKSQSILDYDVSRYNAKKLKGGICEFCNKRKAEEVHHMQYQEDANELGYINDSFHKNHVANLLNVCGICHEEIHKLHRRMIKSKSTKGTVIRELPS